MTDPAAIIAVPRFVAQAVLDIAANSLDWGSGFLDNAEVGHLRTLAELVGADPDAVTPANMRRAFNVPLDEYEAGELEGLRRRAGSLSPWSTKRLAELEARPPRKVQP